MTKPQVTDEQVWDAVFEYNQRPGFGSAVKYMRRVLEQYEASRAIPAQSDWVMVPRDLTEAMRDAWWRTHFSDVPEPNCDKAAYRAMLAAAPPAPVG